MQILIAEDERITRANLQRQLQSWGHTVTAAEDGQQAWEFFQSNNFDLVITDWEMPRLSGLAFVRKIREAPKESYSYVILLTARSDKSDLVEGIEAGADDFVTKPFDREELRVRLLAGQRIIRLEQTLSRQNADLRNANEKIRSALRAAARVQQSMLPQDPAIITPRLNCAWKYVPTDELAGDAIGLHLIDDRYLIAYVLDVSGHGVPAALLSMSAMHLLAPTPPEVSLLRDLSRNDPQLGTIQHPAKVAAELNRRFRSSENDGRYLTMILCVLDTSTGLLHLTSAGHPPPLLLRGSEAVPLPDSGGFPIAMFDDADYEQSTFQLQKGDTLTLFSDGLIEQTAPASDDQFGHSRLLSCLNSNKSHSPAQLVCDLVASLSAHARTNSFTDDVSLVSLRWS